MFALFTWMRATNVTDVNCECIGMMTIGILMLAVAGDNDRPPSASQSMSKLQYRYSFHILSWCPND